MKKIFATLITCGLLISAMTGCSSHSHNESAAWTADAKSHWKACDGCDKKLQAKDHTLNDASRCTVCNSDVNDFGDSVSVYTYDANENPLRMADYDAEGNLLTETVFEYEYDADGNIKKSKEYIDGFLGIESKYNVSDGESIVTKTTQYNEDGTKFTNDYDSNGNVTVMIDYDAEGNVTLQTDSQYAQTDDGEWYESKRTEVYADGMKIEAEYNEHSENISRVCYDADGNADPKETWEYTYDDNGNKVTEKAYVDGVLTEEKIYKTVTEEDFSMTYAETITVYEEDGSKTVSVYNENDELVSETKYDADGNVVE